MFKPVDSKVEFPAMERDMLSWWSDNDILRKYLKRNEYSDRTYSFVDGPITANNPMGVHHAWGRTYKDLFLRYKTMQGFKQRYQNGFDGQGLWIEVEVEKELGFQSKRDIEAFGVGKFVELCKERVRRFSDVITRQSLRLAYWMDWEDSYQTMSDENNYTIWRFLKRCHERGWIYEGTDVMPWCPRCGTGLSEHEIVTEGYKEISHPGLFVRFPIDGRSRESLLVWTTTPWTLTSNVAAAVHPDFTYVKVKQGDETLYLVKGRVSVLNGDYEVLEEIGGSELTGLRYSGPFGELPAQRGVEHRVIEWEEVSESEGTGIVHIAPGAGKEDFALGKELGLATIAPLDELGHFIEGFDWLSGESVFDVNERIYDNLRAKGVFYRVESYLHRYPVCWRCDTELVFRLVDEWFISMDELRELIAKVTRQIRWIPEFGLQRELDWLHNMDDWMISKKRYWGLALPIYKCGCGNFEVMGSEHELEERAVEGWDEFRGHSPHRPWVDAVKVECSRCGARISRVRDVGNPWLDAGIVPFSTLDYRGDSDHWRTWFPADWISESFPGQFRNWFYSLLTMSTALENSAPFRTVFSYALMRDEKGEEMHKSKGNAIWFDDAAEQMGVDAMRWVYTRQNPSANMNFGRRTVDEVRRRFMIPLWNVYSFFVTYANIDRYDPATPAPPAEDRPELDRWILSELNSLILEVTEALDNFEPDRASHATEQFVDYLSNWYVRRSRRRFWKSGIVGQADGGADEDKLGAYATLHECLTALTRLLAPFIPFVTESMYQNLTRSGSRGAESVHLDSFPQADISVIDRNLSDATRLAMRLSSLGRAARGKAGIKVRQPLERALVKLRSAEESELLDRVASQVREELNVKEVVTIADDAEVVEVTVQANMAMLGRKYRARSRDIANALTRLSARNVATLIETGNSVEVHWIPGGAAKPRRRPSGPQPMRPESVKLWPEDINVLRADRSGYSVVSDGGYTVAVTTGIGDDLAREGLARELVHRIQNMRRSAGFDIADHIVTYYSAGPKLDEMMAAHRDYIMQETLSRAVLRDTPPEDSYAESHALNGIEVTLGVRKAE